MLEEFLEPELEIEPVPEHEVGVLRLQDVARRRLVVVDLRAGLGDRLDRRRVAGDVPGHVGDDGEGRDGLEPGLGDAALRHQPKHRSPRNRRKNDAPAPIKHSFALLCRPRRHGCLPRPANIL